YAVTGWVRGWQRRGWNIAVDCAASTLFETHPQVLVERLWGPLCLAALNVRLHEASARVFLRVLGDTLGAAASASDLLHPGTTSTQLPAEAAERAIAQAGGDIVLRDAALGRDTPP